MLQMDDQIVNKENDAKREKMMMSEKMRDLERVHQQLSELRTHTEHLKDTLGLLQKENAALQDVISEQKVNLRGVVCIGFALNIKHK